MRKYIILTSSTLIACSNIKLIKVKEEIPLLWGLPSPYYPKVINDKVKALVRELEKEEMV